MLGVAGATYVKSERQNTNKTTAKYYRPFLEDPAAFFVANRTKGRSKEGGGSVVDWNDVVGCSDR
jgi:hypothetical protein